jgi:hypothetical protein
MQCQKSHYWLGQTCQLSMCKVDIKNGSQVPVYGLYYFKTIRITMS